MKMNRICRLLSVLGSALLFPVTARSAPAGAPGDSRIAVLDPVFVEASPVASGAGGIPWQYFREPGFEIISRCPNSFNEAYARALVRAAAARRALLPSDLWGDLPTPIKVVLYNRPPEPSEGVVATSPIDLTWSGESSAIIGSDAIELSHPVTLGDGDVFINCGNYWDIQPGLTDFSVDVDSAILLGKRAPQLPAWFVAGLEGPCGLYSHRVIQTAPQGDVMVLPNAVWTSAAETIAIQDEARKSRKDGGRPGARPMLPLDVLLNGGVSAERRELWNAEAALFVRWGLFGSGKGQAFLDFVREAAREPASEASFRRFMGMGYADARERLGEYLPEAAINPIRVAIEVAPDEQPDIRDATSTEVARIVGEWGRLEGRSAGALQYDYQRECLDQADRLFERIVARKETDPQFLASFGLYALQVGDNGRARSALEGAADAGVVRPGAYVELARLRLENALPAVQGGIGDLSEAEFTAILGLLTTARTQMPALADCYFVFARALEHAPTRPRRADLLPLDEALRLLPRNAALAYKVATLYRKLGYPADAAAVVRRAMGFAESEKERALLGGFPVEAPR
jgi:hypothetical protein